jgi:2-methylisocitrate lyase-like PEP mutase family enzyme
MFSKALHSQSQPASRGLSIEDRIEGASDLYDIPTSVERLKAARTAIDRSGEDVMLVARTEGLLLDAAALKPSIEKLVAFAEAGADCPYAPGARDRRYIAELVRAVAPKPLDVVMMRPGLTFPELADLGVRRISLGGAFARRLGIRHRCRESTRERAVRHTWERDSRQRIGRDVSYIRKRIN